MIGKEKKLEFCNKEQTNIQAMASTKKFRALDTLLSLKVTRRL